jgi:hypothetical protein
MSHKYVNNSINLSGLQTKEACPGRADGINQQKEYEKERYTNSPSKLIIGKMTSSKRRGYMARKNNTLEFGRAAFPKEKEKVTHFYFPPPPPIAFPVFLIAAMRYALG